MNTSSMKLVERLGDQPDKALVHGISRVSIQADAHGLPFGITLWQHADIGTKIESVMHDLAERIEVGVLSATRVSVPSAHEVFIAAPSEFAGDLKLTKLVIEVELQRLESGLILTGRGGRELVIVAGAYPYSLAILGLGEAPHRFEPEYPLASYKRQKVL